MEGVNVFSGRSFSTVPELLINLARRGRRRKKKEEKEKREKKKTRANDQWPK